MKLVTALVGAAVLSGAVAWASSDGSAPSAATPFWHHITPIASEINLPRTVGDIAKRSDAVVVAHVTDVTEGREDRGYYDPTPVPPGVAVPRTVFVHLTVDRVVHGPVSENQVLKLEMYKPPRTITIEDVRNSIPPGQLLFFLESRAEGAKRSGFSSPLIQLQEKGIWGPVTLSRAVIAEGPHGLEAALRPSEEAAGFLASFQASTVQGAADRVAAELR